MNYIKSTIKGAAAASIIIGLIVVACIIVAAIGITALAAFVVLFPLLLLTRPAVRHLVRWANEKITKKLTAYSKAKGSYK